MLAGWTTWTTGSPTRAAGVRRSCHLRTHPPPALLGPPPGHIGLASKGFEYFRDLLTGPLGRDPTGLRALDIGCGGGFLAEDFARLGCRVVGVDPSEISIETARRHAAGAGLDVTYLVGAGEQLPVADSSFDIAYCCDVLEHVSDFDTVIAETARALKPRGVYFFDTVNRTVVSRVVGMNFYRNGD
jgi:2-polyprenyl-6-hydroxyphenyl methylase/3-demethylubiquinone-9 3-methyltransferase